MPALPPANDGSDLEGGGGGGGGGSGSGEEVILQPPSIDQDQQQQPLSPQLKTEVVLPMAPSLREAVLSQTPMTKREFSAPVTISGGGPSNATPVATRTRLSEGEKLQLLRLCVQRGEEYCGRREEFWARRTEEMNSLLSQGRTHNQGRTISNARTVVSNMLKKYELEFPEGEKSLLPETDLSQTLRAWKEWVDRSNIDKSAKKSTGERDDIQTPRQTVFLGDNSQMDKSLTTATPVPLSKKRIFEEAVAALHEDETESESDQSDQTPPVSTITVPQKRKSYDVQREKKRKIRDRSETFDEHHVKQGDEMIGLVKELVSHIVGKKEARGPEWREAEEPEDREIVTRLTRLEQAMAEIKEAVQEMQKANEMNFVEILGLLRAGNNQH